MEFPSSAVLCFGGESVTVYDPEAMVKARRAYPELHDADPLEEAVRGADVVALVAEWQEFRSSDPSPQLFGTELRIIAGRRALDAAELRAEEWQFRALGRPANPAAACLEEDIRDGLCPLA